MSTERLLEYIHQARFGTERIHQDEDSAARHRVAPVVLIAHMKDARRVVPLDEQQTVEIEQRVGERDAAGDPPRPEMEIPPLLQADLGDRFVRETLPV